MSNPYIGKTWVDRVSEYPTRRTITDTTTLVAQQVTVVRDEGTVTEQGDVFDAATMNNLESRINAAFGALTHEISATLAAGSTTIILADQTITTSSTVDIYTDTWGISPEAVVVNTGSITLTFAPLENPLAVKVKVMN
jgi:hypothetical protein